MSGKASMGLYCGALFIYFVVLYMGMVAVTRGSHVVLAAIGALFISIIPMAIVGMTLEERPLDQMFNLKGSWAFILGDSLALPVTLAAAAYAWRFLDRTGAWYTSNAWVAAALVIGVMMGVGFRVMDSVNYSCEALVSPTKILHDPFVYSVFGATVVFAGVPVLVVAVQRLFGQASAQPTLVVAATVALAGVMLWGAFGVRDMKVGLNSADLHPRYDWSTRTARWVDGPQ